MQVEHVQQLAALLGAAADIAWVPAAAASHHSGTACGHARDLDLGIRLNANACGAAVHAQSPSKRGRSPTRSAGASEACTGAATPPASPRAAASSGAAAAATPPRSAQSGGAGAGAVRALLLHTFAEHIAAALPQVAEACSAEADRLRAMLQHADFNASKLAPLPRAELPQRPASVSRSGAATPRGVTPVRNNSSRTQTPAPAPSRTRLGGSGALPSNAPTPQSNAHRALLRAEPILHSDSLQSAPHLPPKTPKTPAACSRQPAPGSPVADRSAAEVPEASERDNGAAKAARRLRRAARTASVQHGSTSGASGAVAAGGLGGARVPASPLVAHPLRTDAECGNAIATASLQCTPGATPCKRRRSSDGNSSSAADASAAAATPCSKAALGGMTPHRTPKSARASPAAMRMPPPSVRKADAPHARSMAQAPATPSSTDCAAGLQTQTPSLFKFPDAVFKTPKAVKTGAAARPVSAGSSPASSKAFYTAEPKLTPKANLFSGALPHVRMRAPVRKADSKPAQRTPGHGSAKGLAAASAACATPASVASAQTPADAATRKAALASPDGATKRRLRFSANGAPDSPSELHTGCAAGSDTAAVPQASPFARPRRPAAARGVADAAAAVAAISADDSPRLATAADAAAAQHALSPSKLPKSSPIKCTLADHSEVLVAPSQAATDDAALLAGSILDADMAAMLGANAARRQAAAAAREPAAVRKEIEKVRNAPAQLNEHGAGDMCARRKLCKARTDGSLQPGQGLLSRLHARTHSMRWACTPLCTA